MKIASDLKAFEERLGHSFGQKDLLVRALTHASLATLTRPSNERFEFLGDRVLNLAMAEALLSQDPDAAEGRLAPRLNALVRLETCADVAREIGLGDALKLGRSEMLTGGRKKDALLGDALEAVIAAVFLDAGWNVARATVLRLWGDRIAEADARARDAKSALQEWAQARGLPPPTYVEEAREGPDHQPRFTVSVTVEGRTGRAHAGAKRQAEQAAAADLLAQIEGA